MRLWLWWRWRVRRRILEELAQRVARLEHCEQVVVRVVARTEGGATEQVVVNVPVAVLAELLVFTGQDEVSLLSTAPWLHRGTDGDRFVDVVLARADG